MKQHIDIGIVCLARKTFDFEAAKSIYDQQLEVLNQIEQVTWHAIPDLIIEVEDAKQAILQLKQTPLDGLVILSGTFHLGHLALEFAKHISCPKLLWGLDELPYNGGKIRLNSVCGVNLNASNLYKAGYKDYDFCVGTIDEMWLDAIRVKSALEKTTIGLLGAHAHGFFNLDIDELFTYQEAGVLVNHFELSDVFDYPVDERDVYEMAEELKVIFQVKGISEAQLNKVASLSLKFEGFMKRHGLAALAVRCWPEFAATFGISPCGAMSYLQSKGLILGCEGDVEGVMSMVAHQALGAETPFLADFSQVDLKENFALLWHCGVAPCNLWDKKCERSLDTYFAGGKGVTADFVLKSGQFSVLRLDSAHNQYRVFLGKGEAVPMEKLLRGTYFKGIFDKHVREVLDVVASKGIAHHISVVYGDYTEVLTKFAKMMGWEVVR